jgi:hypothetical protein
MKGLRTVLTFSISLMAGGCGPQRELTVKIAGPGKASVRIQYLPSFDRVDSSRPPTPVTAIDCAPLDSRSSGCQAEVDGGQPVFITVGISEGFSYQSFHCEQVVSSGAFPTFDFSMREDSAVVCTLETIRAQPSHEAFATSIIPMPSGIVTQGAQVQLSVRLPNDAPAGLAFHWYSAASLACDDSVTPMSPMNESTQVVTVTPQSTTAYRVDVVNATGEVVSTARITVCVMADQGHQAMLSLSVSGPGYITVDEATGSQDTCMNNQCSFPFAPGTKVKLVPEGTQPGAMFMGFTGCPTTPFDPATGAVTVTMDGDMTCSASFLDCSQAQSPVAAFTVSQVPQGSDFELTFDASSSASESPIQEYEWTLPPAVGGLDGATCGPTQCSIRTTTPRVTEVVPGGQCYTAYLTVLSACGRSSPRFSLRVPQTTGCGM